MTSPHRQWLQAAADGKTILGYKEWLQSQPAEQINPSEITFVNRVTASVTLRGTDIIQIMVDLTGFNRGANLFVDEEWCDAETPEYANAIAAASATLDDLYPCLYINTEEGEYNFHRDIDADDPLNNPPGGPYSGS